MHAKSCELCCMMLVVALRGDLEIHASGMGMLWNRTGYALFPA